MKTPLHVLLPLLVILNIFLCVMPGGLNDMHAKSFKPAAPLRLTASPWQLVTITAYEQTGASPFAPDTPTDSAYACLSGEQLNAMDKAVRPKLHLKYIDSAWDCENMMAEWRVLCQRWAIDNLTKDLPLSLAALGCYVKIYPHAFDGRFGGEGLHALGLICDNTGTWHFVDVQSGMHVKCEEALYEGSIEPYKIIF